MTGTLLDSAVRGNVKAAMREAGANSADLWMVPVDQLRIAPGFNVRDRTSDYAAKVRWLADQMKAVGFLRECPLSGYIVHENGTDVIYVTAGHRRLEAANLAIKEGTPIEKVPVIAHTQGTSAEDLTVKLVTENQGEPLKPLEVARVCQRLQGYGLDDSEIAKRIGITKPYLSQLLGLLSAPKPVRDMVSAGQVSATLAARTLKKHGDKAAGKLKEGLETAQAKGKAKVTGKHLAPAKVAAQQSKNGFDLVAHLERQRAFSERTFGPGKRTAGVLDHIRKELIEIEAQPDDVAEWVDVILLALDGAWRAGFSPEQIAQAIAAKQERNESRPWPDWRTAEMGKAIEHVRGDSA